MTNGIEDESASFPGSGPSDRALREDFQCLLEVRRSVAKGGSPAKQTALLAALLCARLCENLTGWAARELEIVLTPSHFGRLPIEEQRVQIYRNLALGLPLWQKEARAMLLEGLLALNAGHAVPLLVKQKVRRRALPHRAADAEFQLLKWIRYQRGLGRKVLDAEADVAHAAGCSRAAIAKWPRELAKVHGKLRITLQLELAEEVGRLEATGQTWEFLDAFAFSSNRTHDVWLTAIGLKRDVAQLGRQRLEAIGKRSTGKSEGKVAHRGAD
ncbi:MAG: hypothetical protein P4L90_01445 [Rhodopila sp.]|nr:hypothetical protein [Rhodopila sp.]